MSRQQIDFPVQQVQVVTPPVPPAGAMKLYPKTDNKFYQLTPAGEETVLGGGVSDPLTIGRIILTGGPTVEAPAVQINWGQYISTKDSTGVPRPVLQSTGDNWNAFFANTSGLLFVNYTNTVRIGTVDNSGNLAMIGNITAGGTVIGTSLSISGAGRGTFYRSSTSTVYNNLNMEVTTPAGYPPGIGFHESGSSANSLYKAVGTETFRVRLNSGADHALVLDNYTQTISGKTHSGHFYMSGGGYIFGTYINMSADVQGVAPVYVAGQNGDGYLRWYPKALVNNTPGLIQVGGTYPTMDFPSGTTNTQLAYVYCSRTGYWAFSYSVRFDSSSDNCVIYGRYAGVDRFSANWNPGNGAGGTGLGGCYPISAGQYIEIFGAHSYNGNYHINNQVLIAWFVPTDAYP